MKITTVETFELTRKLSRAVGPASVLNDTRSTLLVRIGTDEGLVGWGETAPLAGVRESIDNSYAAMLIGRDPLNVQRTWRTQWLAPFESGLAVGAVDIALHDLWGKALGVPIHQLYGGANRTRVQAYASGLCYFDGIDPKDQWVDEALGLVERGFRAIKMRTGRYPPDHELPLVRKVREALPSDVRLMVDAWGSYTLQTALRVGRVFEELGIYWYEEPMVQFGYHGYETLAAALDINVAGGEMLQTREAFKELFERRAVDIVQPDVTICGGISDLLFVADLARLYGIITVPHSWNGAITEAASLQIAALLPDPTLMPGVDAPVLEYDTTENPFIAGGLREPFVFRDGMFDVPTGPGLGIEIDEDWVHGNAVDQVKALVAPGLGRLEVAHVDDPVIGPGQVLVRTMVSGVSAGTEKRKLFTPELGPNDVRGPWPAVGAFGYMAAGTVEDVGAGVDHVRPGDRVFAGRAWGGHRELIDAPATSVIRLPDELGWVEAACSYWGVPPLLGLLSAELSYYDDAAVVGLGPLGLMGVQLLGRMARRVVGLDTVTIRCRLAEVLGAAAGFDPRDAGVGAAIREVLPRGPQVVLEISGTQPGLETALSIVRPRGRVAIVGSQQRLDRFDLFWPLQNSGARIVPIFREGEDSPQSASGSPVARHLPKIQDMLVRGWLQIEPLISWVVPPEAAPRAMDLLHRRPDLGVGMAIAWDASQVRNVDAFEHAWAEDAASP